MPNWQPLFDSLNVHGRVVQAHALAAPGVVKSKKWVEAAEALGIDLVAVPRTDKLQSNDLLVSLEAGISARTEGIDIVALASHDGDFVPIGKRIVALGKRFIAVFRDDCKGRVREKYKRVGAQVVNYAAPREATPSFWKFCMILHRNGSTSFTPLAAHALECCTENASQVDFLTQFMIDLKYLPDAGQSALRCVDQAIAKFAFENSLDDVPLYPSRLAFRRMYELISKQPSRTWNQSSGNYVFCLPVAHNRKGTGDLSLYGSSVCSQYVRGGGGFILKDTTSLVRDILRRLGYLDDSLNSDLLEALDVFCARKDNVRNLRNHGVQFPLPTALHSKLFVVHSVFVSTKGKAIWNIAPRDTSVRQFFTSRGLLQLSDSQECVKAAMAEYCRVHDLPQRKSYNAYVAAVAAHIKGHDPTSLKKPGSKAR
eukprot:TRINITY_DN95375_c0_g1_i1.p1 TRINITY_DN95375_c0_g1~~TRINITY_DN95375_c0_g1_i1.p1  ORF type:complete len:426 (-),score=23.95 TRINITY_DN95375_c0_g1_i1:213-1490(-)